MLLVQFISVNCTWEGFTAVIRDKRYGWAGNARLGAAASFGLHPLNEAKEQLKLSWDFGGKKEW